MHDDHDEGKTKGSSKKNTMERTILPPHPHCAQFLSAVFVWGGAVNVIYITSRTNNERERGDDAMCDHGVYCVHVASFCDRTLFIS